MNILVLHGEDSAKSLKRLTEIIKKSKENKWEVIRTGETGSKLSELLQSNSLFSQKRLYVVDGISQLKNYDLIFLKEKSNEFNDFLVIYSQSIIAAAILKNFPKNTKIEESKLPKYIWNFLDSFYPGNTKTALFMFKKVVEKESPEMVLALLSRHLVSLYLSKISPEKLPIPSWKLSKLQSQAKRFSPDELKNIINELSKIDVLSKTSKGELNDLLDILIATKLG